MYTPQTTYVNLGNCKRIETLREINELYFKHCRLDLTLVFFGFELFSSNCIYDFFVIYYYWLSSKVLAVKSS